MRRPQSGRWGRQSRSAALAVSGSSGDRRTRRRRNWPIGRSLSSSRIRLSATTAGRPPTFWASGIVASRTARHRLSSTSASATSTPRSTRCTCRSSRRCSSCRRPAFRDSTPAPDNPRAIYFNDVATVGYIRGAPLLEIAIQDPQQGVVFYTIDQKPAAAPGVRTARRLSHLPSGVHARFTCRACWSAASTSRRTASRSASGAASIRTTGVRSVSAGAAGTSRVRTARCATWATRSSLDGNRDAILADRTLERTSLDDLFDTKGYLSATSDIAALMVFLHQGRAMNLVTRIGWEARIAAQGENVDLDSSGPLHDGIRELVDYFLFVDEEPLPAADQGHVWIRRSVREARTSRRRGRSLRQLDLEHRLAAISVQLHDLLAGVRRPPGERARMRSTVACRKSCRVAMRRRNTPALTDADRRDVIEILRGTLHDLPADFRATDAARD